MMIVVLVLLVLVASLLSRHPVKQRYQDRFIRGSYAPPVKESVRQKLDEIEAAIRYFLQHAPTDCPKIQRIKQRWNGQIHETAEDDDPQHTLAYSINKGEALHVCIRDAGTGEISDMNSVLFVVFHELAHVAETEYGHGPSFFDTMTYLLELADKMGVYAYRNHEHHNATVCGRRLGHNPLTCVKNSTCDSRLKKK